MDLKELKLALQKGVSFCYLLLGSDSLARNEAFDLIKNTAIPQEQQEYAISIFDGEEVNVEEVIAQAMTYPFLSERRVVYLRGYESLKKNDQMAIVELIEKKIETTVLVLAATTLDLRTTEVKRLTNLAEVISVQPPESEGIISWLVQKARSLGLSMDATVASSIVDRAGSEPMVLLSELEKLVNFKGSNRPQITQTDVEEVVAEGVPEAAKNVIFQFCDAVAMRQPALALQLLDNMLEVGTNHILINHMLSRHFRQLLAVKACRTTSVSEVKNQIDIGVPDFAIRRLINQARSIKLDAIEDAMSTLLENDFKLKRGSDPRTSLESLVLKIIAYS